MSVCIDILKGFDLECKGAEFKKYYQNIVLINRKDVNEYYISSNETENRIYFNLNDGKTGYLFRSSENGGSLTADFSKSDRNGITYYKHRLQVPVVGANENAKTMLKQLDFADYFAAIQFKDGTVEIHGFNYGLKTDPYQYQPQGMGGAVLSLVSKYDEYDPPYTYVPSITSGATGWEQQSIEDFNDLFGGIAPIYQGDFNLDYNDDFNIQGA